MILNSIVGTGCIVVTVAILKIDKVKGYHIVILCCSWFLFFITVFGLLNTITMWVKTV